MTIDDIHAAFAKELLGKHPSEEDALALMIAFHVYKILLKDPILEDRPRITEIAPITHRHAGEAIATAWPDRSDEQRTSYAYWNYQYNARTPYEVMMDIPPDWTARVHHFRERLVNHPIINAMEPED